ncbi:S41 family peptidase [Rhodoligotrophos defluvii]|uniref:S41 family peptidase n=1 Tax=Rhodoligotrophos defluvii TaxID=2561934 RepID=UPI0010CA1F9F|nr:S41 family peptidase [Rhodoligotrophos defluvii]
MRRKFLGAVGYGAVGAIVATVVWNGASALDAATTASKTDTYRQLNLFGDVFDRVRSDYVEPPDEEQLIDSAINGMLSSLDPHSSYMNSERFREMQVQTRGEFGGLGIEVTMENGLVKVVYPIEDTPASRAGVKPDDLIIGIDGQEVMGLTLNQAVDMMRGPVNTPIKLTIQRKGVDKPLDIEMKRAIIRIRAVRSEMEGDVAYIRLTSFNEQTQEGLEQAIRDAKKQLGDKLKGYIIDLRNNPGGLLDAAISVSDTVLDRGEIVSTRGRNADETQRYNAQSGDLLDGKPVVVLINGGSASASEIVAGALQDHKRATLIGTRSFGKGSVQTIIPMGSYGALRLTTARYYTPSGRSIQAQGIEPDIKVEQDIPEEEAGKFQTRGEASLRGHLQNDNGEEASGSPAYVPKEKEKDTQLQYALNYLRGGAVSAAIKQAKPAATTAPQVKAN